MNIEDSNKLIAEFMGLKPNRTPYTYEGSYIWNNYEDIPELSEIIMKELEDEQWYIYPRFDESWDWLMPVVEKIESLELGDWYVHIIGGKNYPTIRIEDGNVGNGLWDCMINVPDCEGFGNDIHLTKLEATYKAVVEFIKWYNNQK